MNKYENLWKIILILIFVNQISFAKTVVGDLSKGDKVSIIPLKGHALSITKKHGFYGNGSFNFTILNKQDIIYEDKDQKDDVYLVFHDSIEEGDHVEIDVVDGEYQYEIKDLVALPNLVLDALKDTPEVNLNIEEKIENEIEENIEEKTENKIEENIEDPISISPAPAPLLVEEKIVEEKEQVLPPINELPLAKQKEEDVVTKESLSFLEQLSSVLGRLFGFSKENGNTDIENQISIKEDVVKSAENIQEKGVVNNPKDYEVKLEKEAEEPMVLERRLSIPVPISSPSPTPASTPVFPDTGYRDQYKDIEKEIDKNKKITVENKSIDVEKESISSSIQEQTLKHQKDDKVRTESPKEEEPEFTQEKIVITKIIDKEANDNTNSSSSMNDRVLGNRYEERESGKLGMKVYKNSRPVAAWIEVFKSGTKERIKTFYTKRGSIPKSVKLPAGNYFIKATYRSPSVKQQKSLKNVIIESGQSVNKKIAFYDGTLKVKVTKDGVPVYAKVVAYRSGTKRISSYAFSNKSSGSCSLTLENGSYDLKISNYRDKKFITGVSIGSGKTKSIKVEF